MLSEFTNCWANAFAIAAACCGSPACALICTKSSPVFELIDTALIRSSGVPLKEMRFDTTAAFSRELSSCASLVIVRSVLCGLGSPVTGSPGSW